VSWEIGGNLDRHERPGVGSRRWLRESTRHYRAAHVVTEITETAWSSDPLRLPETDGRTELLKILVQDEVFVVLAGTLSMYVGDSPERQDVPVGGVIHVEPCG
jgi:mannose-6-phosphate isomerase-like protein (cupin superfamily)